MRRKERRFACPFVAGVDEVGRGPLIGAVVTAAVILDPDKPIPELTDSKKLTEKKRERLFDEIREKAVDFCIASASVEEIDSINILNARMLAMTRAVDGLRVPCDHALIDGNKLLEEIFDDPDSPFAGDELTEIRNLLERSLNELSRLAEWPLKYCDPITRGDSSGGAYFQLSCHYSIGPVTQYLLMRLHHTNGAWYQTTVRTMNKRRLRHFIAISNSFHLK